MTGSGSLRWSRAGEKPMAETVAKGVSKKPSPIQESGPVRFSADGRRRRTFTVKYWSIRHSRLLESAYSTLEKMLLLAAPLFNAIGHERLEKPIAALERGVKGALFDCRMCGACALSSTGMSCPMNCPKQRPLRRRAGERQLRSDRRHAVCLGQGLGRLAADGGGRQDF
jgi:Methylene-tetrahydrofolate reductase C terminal